MRPFVFLFLLEGNGIVLRVGWTERGEALREASEAGRRRQQTRDKVPYRRTWNERNFITYYSTRDGLYGRSRIDQLTVPIRVDTSTVNVTLHRTTSGRPGRERHTTRLIWVTYSPRTGGYGPSVSSSPAARTRPRGRIHPYESRR